MTAAPPRQAAETGPALALGAGLALRLDQDTRGFVLAAGAVDVFVRTAGGPRRPLFRVEAGEAMFGLGALAEVEVLALGGAGTKLRAAAATERALAAAWKARLAERLGPHWDDRDPERALAGWLQAQASADQSGYEARLRRGAIAAGRLLQGVGRLAGVAGAGAARRAASPADDPLLTACQAVADAMGVAPVARPRTSAAADAFEEAQEIARTAGLRVRRTILRPGWRARDAGPLLAWIGETRTPIALLPTARGYTVFDPAAGTRTPLDEVTALALAPEAAAFYRPLPHGPLDARALLGWLAPIGGAELRRALLAALGAALVGLAVPVITGVVIDQAILPSDTGVLVACALALVATALGAAGFLAMQSIAALRLSAGLDAALQAAVIDHLLKLPTQAFKAYSAGDLVDRVYGVEALRRALTGRVVGGVMAGVFCVLGFALMLMLDARLAAVAALMGVLQLAATLFLSRRRLRHERAQAKASGQARGLVLQMLAGVAKLRAAAAETRALGQWLERFTVQVGQFAGARGAEGALVTFNATFLVLATLAIFALAAPAEGASSGRFLAFYAAFGQAMATLVALGAALSELSAAAPHLERLWPVITTAPEGERSGGEAVELTGAVELKHITFAYGPGQRAVVDGLSLQVRAGEFVALVGPSGGGKSTLMRLLLGFEQPQAGSVLYDGRPLESLDLVRLRRQIGVVLQDGKLMTGSLYENICGTSVIPQDRVWEAVRQAGLAPDVEAMPMGLHTLVTEGAGAISGGQRQRLLIARALVRRPRLLLFDEATSALDNPTQAVVSAALAELAVTRIVIAHRLSTVREADRIFVVDRGRIVQEGTFASLSRQPGLFADLAQRQLI